MGEMVRIGCRAGSLVIVIAAVLAAALPALAIAQTSSQSQTNSQRVLYCRDLEQQLARDWQASGQGQELLPRIEDEIRKFDRIYQRSQAKSEQADCYDYFFFTKTLRNTPQCIKLQNQIEEARGKLAELEQQRQRASSSYDQRTRQDALIAELARQGCGPQYQQEAQRRTNRNNYGFWDDGEGADPGLTPYQGQTLPYATYRTICVRLCDGYYFPISYATLPTAFDKDAAACTSQCAAPAELYVYQNPGAEVESATSLAGTPYTDLKTAWRYRKQLVTGCSCKVAEFDPKGGMVSSQQQGSAEPAAAGETQLGANAQAPADAAEATTGDATGLDDDQIQALLDRSGQAAPADAQPQ